MEKEEQQKEIKEEFCGACLAIPVAFAGVGASAYGSKRGSHKKQKQMCFYGGMITICMSLLIIFYFMRIKECKKCIAPPK